MLCIQGTSFVFMPCDLIGGTPTFMVILRRSFYFDRPLAIVTADVTS
jgi:hypothetical protein